MADFKIPEGEKFFAFMVWVALVGAALILAIDYTMKRQLLSLAKELREGGLNEQGSQAGVPGPIAPAVYNAPGYVGRISVADATGVETNDDIEHVPFPIRTLDRPRESNGRFAPTQTDDSGGNRNTEVPSADIDVES
jgi:hypothetical protein